MPKMGVDTEKLKASKPAPGGWYKLKLKGFRPKKGKNDPESVNYNAELEIVENKQEFNGIRAFMTLSTKFATQIQDFSHGLGFPLEPSGDIAGNWLADPADPENVEKMQYQGPLLGRTLDAELIESEYQGTPKNEVKQIRCKIDGCATKFPDIRHMTNMIKKSK